MERRRVHYTGRVQGVGFRQGARWIAEKFKVTGHVRNEPDGSVTLEAQGEPAELDRFLAAIRRERSGYIATETVELRSPDPDERSFAILR